MTQLYIFNFSTYKQIYDSGVILTVSPNSVTEKPFKF